MYQKTWVTAPTQLLNSFAGFGKIINYFQIRLSICKWVSIDTLNKYLLIARYMPGALLGIAGTIVNKIHSVLKFPSVQWLPNLLPLPGRSNELIHQNVF